MAKAKEKKPMKQGRRQRGMTKGMEKAIADRRDNPKNPKRFPEKDDVPRSTPGRHAKGTDRSRAPGARTRRKTASPKRNAK